jgi:hypothetical protein
MIPSQPPAATEATFYRIANHRMFFGVLGTTYCGYCGLLNDSPQNMHPGEACIAFYHIFSFHEFNLSPFVDLWQSAGQTKDHPAALLRIQRYLLPRVVIVSAQSEQGHNSKVLAGRNSSPRRFHGRVTPHGITTAT